MSMLMPTMASPRPLETFAMTSGSSKNVVALTIAAARLAGSPDLKMPEPTKTPSAPSCIIIAASAGVARPPAGNSTTGSFPARAPPPTSRPCGPRALGYQLVRRLELLGGGDALLGRQVREAADALAERAHVPGGLDHVAG